MIKFTRRAAPLAAALTLALGAPNALAQADYPNKPIRFIAPTTAGATADILARIVANEMQKHIGQTIVVEAKPGANQIIGLEYLAKQPADGYNVGVLGVDGVALLPLTTKSLRFDPLKDLTPVASIGEVRYVMAGSVDRPWKNFKELIAHIKANPGKVNYGSSVPAVRFPTLLLIQELGLDIVHVPFGGGGGPYLTAIAAGTVDFGIAGEGTGTSLKPRVRFFAVTGKTRLAADPDVPTFAELGFPRVYGPTYSLSVRTGTPKAIGDKLSAALQRALQSPETRTSMAKAQFEITYEDAAGAARTLDERSKFYTEFALKVGLKPE